MMRKSLNLLVYFVADPSVCAGRDVADVVRAAIRGGVTMVQYRDKTSSQDAKKVKDAVRQVAEEEGRCIPFLINDHVDVAKEIGADGVHLGQGDMNPAEARRILGEDAIVGVTAFTPEQISAIDPDIVDYIGTGPFYETETKKGKPVLGAARFAELVACSPVPVVGIGGITPGNAGSVMKAGANGVAMMRAISEAPDPEQAARDFVEVDLCAKIQ